MTQTRKQINKNNSRPISEKEASDFKKYMINLFPDLKAGRQRPRNPLEKQKLTEWAEGNPNELKKI